MSEPYADYIDFYRRGPYSQYLQEQRLAGSAQVGMLAVGQAAGSYPDPPTDDFALQLLKRGSTMAEVDLGAGRTQFRFERNLVVLSPPNVQCDYVIEGPHEILVAALPSTAVLPILDEAGSAKRFGDFGRLHAGPFRDDTVTILCERLWREAASGSPSSRLFADSAVQTLVLALLRQSEMMADAPDSIRGTVLAPWRLRRCLDFLRDNLSDDIGLDELAASAGLTSLYFAKAFKRSTGVAPHDYLMRQRVERAKALLIDTDLKIAEIASSCGFCDQSHLARRFKRLVGIAPAAFRAEVRS